MAVLAFLFKAQKNVLGLLAGLLVHAGLLYLLLESPGIRDILRVHLVELILQIPDLAL